MTFVVLKLANKDILEKELNKLEERYRNVDVQSTFQYKDTFMVIVKVKGETLPSTYYVPLQDRERKLYDIG